MMSLVFTVLGIITLCIQLWEVRGQFRSANRMSAMRKLDPRAILDPVFQAEMGQYMSHFRWSAAMFVLTMILLAASRLV